MRSARQRMRDDPVYAFAAATALSQVFPAIVAPLLARLYSPASFGGYATFVAIAAIASTVVAFSMQNAILTEPDDDDAVTATICSLVAPFSFAFVLSLVLVVTPDTALIAAFPPIDPDLLRWLPLTILVSSVFLIGYTWLLRSGRYRELAANKLWLAATTAVLQIAIGFAQVGALGLILANLAGVGVATVGVWLLILRDQHFTWRWPRLTTLWAFYSRHHQFALYTTPAQLVNSGSSYLPDLLIGRLFGAEVLGHYALGMRMVVMPLAFVATTAQDVYRKESAREHAATGGSERAFRKGFTILSGVAGLLLLPLIVSLPFVFPVVFGDRWEDSGRYMLAMTPLLLIRFVSSPLSYTWIVAGKQRQDLYWQVGLLALTFGTLWLPLYWVPDITPIQLFLIYGNGVAGWYLLALFLSYRWSRPSR